MLSHPEAIFRLGAATTGYPPKVAKRLPIPGVNRSSRRLDAINQFPNSRFLSRFSSIAFAQFAQAALLLRATMQSAGQCLPAVPGAPRVHKNENTKRTHFAP